MCFVSVLGTGVCFVCNLASCFSYKFSMLESLGCVLFQF